MILSLATRSVLVATLPAGVDGAWQAFGFEVLLTFFLIFVIMTVATNARR